MKREDWKRGDEVSSDVCPCRGDTKSGATLRNDQIVPNGCIGFSLFHPVFETRFHVAMGP